MFGVGLVDEKNREKMLDPFAEMGRVFARSGRFEKSVVNAFATPEYMSKNRYGHLTCSAKPSPAFSCHALRKSSDAEKNWTQDR